MSEHANAWLDAYYDGELEGRRLSAVEKHLAQCSSCQQTLKELNGISSLLRSSPDPEGTLSADQFVAQVGLRMSRMPDQPLWQRAISLGWQWTPVGILGLWSFLQAVFIVAGSLFLAVNLGFGGETLASLVSSSQAGLSVGDLFLLQGESLSEILRTGLDFLRMGGPFGWSLFVNLGISFALGLLYCSWLVSWWIRNRSPNNMAMPLGINLNGH
jgi:hypothetical protein